MPRTYKLTWQSGSRSRSGRWRKKHKGRAYYFDGGRGKTDRDAYEAALAKWEQLRIKLDAEASKPHQETYEREISRWEYVLSWSNKHGDASMAQTAEARLTKLRQRFQTPKPPPVRLEDTFEGQFHRSIRTPKLDRAIREIASAIDLTSSVLDFPVHGVEQPASNSNGSTKRDGVESVDHGCDAVVSPAIHAFDQDPLVTEKAIWDDRLEVMRRSVKSLDVTLRAHVQDYLENRRRDVAAGELSAGRAAKLTTQLMDFQDWCGADSDVSEISGKLLMDYRVHLLSIVESGKWSSTTTSDRIVTVKSFIRWLWQMEAIPTLPRVMNGKSKALEISKSRKPIETFDVDEVALLLQNASERTRLYVLLALNCGMTQQDISDLLLEEVDWKAKRIKRKRSKTKRFDAVPVVEYLLWEETFQLLAQQRNHVDQGRVLVNENGDPICREEFGEDGKYKRNDNVKTAYDRLKAKTGIDKPLKSLKKTSASMIRSSKEYTGLEDLYLGHAPQKMSDRHYAKAPQELLDEAIEWLREQYGISQYLTQDGVPRTQQEQPRPQTAGEKLRPKSHQRRAKK